MLSSDVAQRPRELTLSQGEAHGFSTVCGGPGGVRGSRRCAGVRWEWRPQGDVGGAAEEVAPASREAGHPSERSCPARLSVTMETFSSVLSSVAATRPRWLWSTGNGTSVTEFGI